VRGAVLAKFDAKRAASRVMQPREALHYGAIANY
jgi:hypothetical protein